MQVHEDPPALEEFAEIYVAAVNSLSQKIKAYESNLGQLKKEKSEIENQQKNVPMNNSMTGEKKLVFRVVEHDNLESYNPIIKLKEQKNELLVGNLEKFVEGEVIVPIDVQTTQIDVCFYNSDGKEALFNFGIPLLAYQNKKRKTKREVFAIKGQDLYLDFDAQIIETPLDFYDGLWTANQRKTISSTENLQVFLQMQNNLQELFKSEKSTGNKFQSNNNEPEINREFDNFGQNDLNYDFGENRKFDFPEARDSIPINDQRTFTAPFLMDASQINENPKLPIFENEINPEKRVSSSRNPQMASSGLGQMKPQQIFTPVNNVHFDLSGFVTKFHQSPYSWHLMVHVLFYLNVFLALITCFVNLHRASFVSLTLCLGYIGWYLSRDEFENLLSPGFYAAAYGVALLMDVLWLTATSANLITNGAVVSDGTMAGMDGFVLFMSFILVFLEAACLAVSLVLNSTGVFTKSSDWEKKKQVQVELLN